MMIDSDSYANIPLLWKGIFEDKKFTGQTFQVSMTDALDIAIVIKRFALVVGIQGHWLPNKVPKRHQGLLAQRQLPEVSLQRRLLSGVSQRRWVGIIKKFVT